MAGGESWSSREVSLLKSCYLTSTNEQLAKLFPNRTAVSIYKKAYKMGMRKPAEIEWKNRSNVRKGPNGSNWHGGVHRTSKGYIMRNVPDHPRADKNGYVFEHILVFEEATGIRVPDGCCIHHLNGNKADNRISNLCLMTHAGHTVFHHSGKPLSEDTKRKISERKKRKC